jgi:hypothetical protein|tara:strand:+ start:277 stop:474 length:198 start_codon:yes stop_codon:yes gene_type:complete
MLCQYINGHFQVAFCVAGLSGVRFEALAANGYNGGRETDIQHHSKADDRGRRFEIAEEAALSHPN